MSGYGPFWHSICAGLLIITFAGGFVEAQDTIRTIPEDTLYQRILELEHSLNEINKTLAEQN
ncbi:MAG: hypothetical protein DRJ13_06725, partial [Bacteroidetes bacterium]